MRGSRVHREVYARFRERVVQTCRRNAVRRHFPTPPQPGNQLLAAGDTITLTTALGTRTYAVDSVVKVGETDTSGTQSTAASCITLYTCVMDERDYRWCVRGYEV